MSDLFDLDEYTDYVIEEEYGIRPSKKKMSRDEMYPPQTSADVISSQQEVAFRETPVWDQYMEEMQKSKPRALYSLIKGITQGEIGIGGDIEDISKTIKAYFSDPKTEEEVNQVIADLESNTFLPTTAEAKVLVENIAPELEGYRGSEKLGEMLSPALLLGGALKLFNKLLRPEKGAIAAVTLTNDKANQDVK